MRFLKLAVVVVGAVALASCGDDGTGPGNGGDDGPTPTVVNSSADNTLYETVPTFPPDTVFTNGGGTQMFAGKTAGAGGGGGDIPRIRRALVKFVVHSVIQPGATIDSVCLVLSAVKSPNATATSVSLHRVTMDWGEGTIVGAAAGGEGGGDSPDTNDVTWDHTFYPDSKWTTRGGDFVSAASATITVGATNGRTYKWGSTSMMVADVQAWLDTPGNNFGWVLVGAEASTDSLTVKGFGTRENSPANQPQLKVYHTGP